MSLRASLTSHDSRLTTAYIGLGSNLGDRAANLWEAVRRLGDLDGCSLVRMSALYETAPVGGIPQGDFLNAAAGLVVSLSAEELMAAAKGIECAMGREPGPRWGPRLIDLDILLYGDAEIRTDDLVVPHPELWNRLFVLGPLSDILPPGHLADRVQQRMREIDGEQRIEPYRPRPRQP